MLKKEFKHNNKGFTLMEVMVAMSIIIIGLTVSLGLIAFTISSGTQDKNRLIAMNLAQEGIELVRNIRDDNWRHATDGWEWDDNIKNITKKRFDYNDYEGNNEDDFKMNEAKYRQCDDDGNELKLHDIDGYQYNIGTLTIFNRCIDTKQVGAGPDKSIEVTSDVHVVGSKSDYHVVLVSYLYDWKQ